MGKHSHSHSHSHSHKDHDKKRRKRRHGHEKHRKRDSSSSSSSSSDEELQWEEKVVETTSSTTPAFNENTTTNLISNIDNHPNETLNTEKKENVLQEPANVPVPNSNISDTHSLMTSDVFENIFSNNVKTRQELREEKAKREEEDKEKRRLALELNPYFKNGGKGIPENEEEEEEEKLKKPKYTIGDAGSKWRMMKLRRVYEMAEEEGKPVEEIALMRYGSLEEFQEAVHEKEVLDQKRGNGRSTSSSHRSSKYNSNVKTGGGHFKKPKEYSNDDNNKMTSSLSSTNTTTTTDKKDNSSQPKNLLSIPTMTTPVPTTTTPQNSNEPPVLTKNQLNKLNSKIMKARLMNSANLKELEEQYEKELKRYEEAKTQSESKQTVVLPQFNSEGRLQDIGKIDPYSKYSQYNRKKHKKEKFESHDEQGNRIRYYKDDDKLTLHDLMVQEKMSSNKDFDREMAMRISRDAVFSSDLDYLDENAERLSKRKERTEEQKRKVSINDYKRYQEALDKCFYCYNQEKTPSVPVVSLGNKVYLALPNVVEMVPGHCLIVPMNHVLTTLECEDDIWDEIRNFMKCLIQMFAAEERAVVFMETVLNLRKQRHTVIECIPLSYDDYDDSPAYFKDAILKESEEWSQHRKIIDTSKNGFRRSMVKDLPYFHVWFDPNRGIGHVIEKEDFPPWFGKEVIAGMMDLPTNLWRRPKRISSSHNRSRIEAFKKKWDKYDWKKIL
jgi:diadenosine tetraphosphate (Ap4A) HIT family hydrolase